MLPTDILIVFLGAFSENRHAVIDVISALPLRGSKRPKELTTIADVAYAHDRTVSLNFVEPNVDGKTGLKQTPEFAVLFVGKKVTLHVDTIQALFVDQSLTFSGTRTQSLSDLASLIELGRHSADEVHPPADRPCRPQEIPYLRF